MVDFPYAQDGYAALGLTGNPFVAEQAPGVAAALWMNRAGAPEQPRPGECHLVQVIGPKGAGKTSTLLNWRAARPGPYHYVAPGPARWKMPPTGPLVYWDEIDRLAVPTRIRAFRYAARRRATIAAGTHRDLSRSARACGLKVTSYEFPLLTPVNVQEWAALRITEVARPGVTPSLTLDADFAAEVCAAAGASLREAAVILHRWAAERARSARPT